MSTKTLRSLPTLGWVAGLAVLTGVLAGCGIDGDTATGAAARPAAVAPDGAAEPSPGQPAPTESAVVNSRATDLGTVATDPAGLTLYRFDKDSNKPPASACEGACAQNWLPLTTAGGPVAGAGVDGDLLGTVERADATQQVTLNGWPLYTFVGDRQPGETSGEGVQGTWHAIAPSGKPVVAAPAQDAAGKAEAPGNKAESGGSQDERPYGY